MLFIARYSAKVGYSKFEVEERFPELDIIFECESGDVREKFAEYIRKEYAKVFDWHGQEPVNITKVEVVKEGVRVYVDTTTCVLGEPEDNFLFEISEVPVVKL